MTITFAIKACEHKVNNKKTKQSMYLPKKPMIKLRQHYLKKKFLKKSFSEAEKRAKYNTST
jgi:hypothetical protein